MVRQLGDGTTVGGVYEEDGSFHYNCEHCSTSFHGGDELLVDAKADAHEKKHQPEKPATTRHATPRMHQLPNDPAYFLLDNVPVTPQKVHRKRCYICEDREYARMGLPLCNLCCACAALGKTGHIAADDEACDDCKHQICKGCVDLPPQEDEICTCDTPCCEADVGIGVITCGGQHCPTHGTTGS